MERYIGLDVHAASTTFAVIGESGKRLGTHVVETNGQALVEQLETIAGKKHVCLEEGTQSAWLYEILSGIDVRDHLARCADHRGARAGRPAERGRAPRHRPADGFLVKLAFPTKPNSGTCARESKVWDSPPFATRDRGNAVLGNRHSRRSVALRRSRPRFQKGRSRLRGRSRIGARLAPFGRGHEPHARHAITCGDEAGWRDHGDGVDWGQGLP